MFKITIDNEEVITDKDFTIEEEMLNTPSVILNNVYPKEWEQDKDYLNFYHPNEYSKCKIYDEEIIPASEGDYIEGTDFSITYDDTKEFNLLSLKGDTYQETTTGKNLLNIDGTRTSEGLTNVTSGTIISVSGTSSNTYSSLTQQITQNIPIGTYTFSIQETYNKRIGFIATFSDNTNTTYNITANQLSTTFTTTKEIKSYRLYMETVSGTTYNMTIKPQLEKGTQATSYEPYTYGASPNPNYPQEVQTVSGRQEVEIVGKNLFNLGTFTPKTNQTMTISQNNASSIIFNGSASGTLNFWFNDLSMTLTAGTYYFSLSNSDNNIAYFLRNNGTNIFSSRVNGSFTINNNTTIDQILIQVYSGASKSNQVVDIQLEKGNQQTTYEEYKGKNYEINLGKNLFDYTTTSFTNPSYVNIETQNETITITTLSTQTSNNLFLRTKIPDNLLQHGATYTISSVNVSGMVQSLKLQLRNKDGSNAGQSTGYSVTYDSTYSLYVVCNPFATTGSTSIPAGTVAIVKNVQVEKGNATSYSPYKTPIELCKIGNYQDYIFKNTTDSDYYDNTLEQDAWYLHKAINKVVLNGTETWSGNGQTTNFGQYVHTITDKAYGTTNMLCNTFNVKNTNAENSIAGRTNNSNIYITIAKSIVAYNTNTFKTWLSNHNVSVYYVLDTPTTEPIEDSELLGQLEEINLLNGLNNISVSSPYLTTPIKIHYNFNEEIINQDLYFCGVVKNSGNISLNPREPHFQSLQVLSYKTFLSEGETLDFVIYEKTIREAIEQVVSAIQDYGFVVGDINILNPDEIIGAYSTKDKSAYDVFQYIADITQSRWTTRMIDEDTIAIDFYDPSLMQLGTTLDYTQEFFEDNLIDDMSYSYGTNDYRNKQIMTSQEVYSNINQIQNIVANGYQTQFNTEQQIGKINSIKIGGVDYTFATNTEKDMGVIADFYYSAGNNYFESASTVSIGTVIVIDYLPIVEGRQIITNSNEIDRVANSTGVKGVVARYENRNDATTSTELQLIGQSYIKYKGVPEIVLTVITRKNIWDVGQRVQFNAPINELAVMYMVRKKAIHRITTIDTIFYTFELVSSFNSETAVNYFDNQRAKANGNIGEGEYISRNIDIQSTANIIFYDTQANEITVVGDNILNCTLESPFVS